MSKSLFWYFMILVMLVVVLPSCKKHRHSNVKPSGVTSPVSTPQKPTRPYHPQLTPAEIYCKRVKGRKTCYYLHGDKVYKVLRGKWIPAKVSADRIRDTRRSGFVNQGYNY